MASAAVASAQAVSPNALPVEHFLSTNPEGYKENPAPSVEPFQPIQGPTVWYSDLPREKYEYFITEADVKDLDAALEAIKERGITKIEDITRADFSLGAFGQYLDGLNLELLYGIGFRVVRGLPVERWGLRNTATALWIIGLFFGKAISQNSAGHLIGHVRTTYDSPKPLKFNRDANELRYHSDNSDIVVLLCLQPAKSGGESSWLSSHALHNEILRLRPDLHKVLAEPVYQVRGDKPPPGRAEWFKTRMWHYYQGKLGRSLAVEGIKPPNSADGLPGAEPATPAQIEAYKFAQEVAAGPRLRIDGKLGPGDFVIQHNLHTFHARNAYEDWEDKDKKRHMLRLWPLDPLYADRWGSAEVGKRGNVLQARTVPHVTVDPLDAIAELGENWE